MTINAVLREYDNRGVQLSLTHLDNDTVLLEGDRQSLEFLASLLLAHVAEDDCGFSLGPTTAGSAWFADSATLNLYIHRLPCEHPAPESSGQ